MATPENYTVETRPLNPVQKGAFALVAAGNIVASVAELASSETGKAIGLLAVGAFFGAVARYGEQSVIQPASNPGSLPDQLIIPNLDNRGES